MRIAWTLLLALLGMYVAASCGPPQKCEGAQCAGVEEAGDGGIIRRRPPPDDGRRRPPPPPDTPAPLPDTPPPVCAKKGASCASMTCCAGLACDGAKLCQTPTAGPVKVQKAEFFYKIKGSDGALVLWTAPNVEKVKPSDPVPADQSDALKVYSARREFEPFQLLLRGASAGSAKVSWQAFGSLGAGARFTAAKVGYVKGHPETLTPIASGASVAIPAGQHQALWFTVYVPPTAKAGRHAASIQIQLGAKSYTVPVELHVFDFALPKETHFYSQMNLSVGSLMDKKGSYQEQLDRAKAFLMEHRFTPKAPVWPSGFSYKITWDNSKNPKRCAAFFDEPNEGKPYSVKHLAARYIKGEGWNDGVGFPSFMLFQFVNNSTPRPASFCGSSRGSGHEGSAAYNDAYGRYLKALQDYLVQHGYIDKAYYYVMNEPQNDKDHALAAHLCRLIKKAAPRLKIAVSEEPKPEIFNDPKGACGYDIWIAHIRAYDPVYKVAWQRQKKGERVWWYSLDHDAMPYFNPTLVERSGMDVRVIPWLSWKFRVEGWAYYNMGSFLTGRQPTVRFELMREGFEDYEYLWLANQQKRPQPEQAAIPDAAVGRLVSSLTSFSRDSASLAKLRLELGRYLGKERKDIPLIEASGSTTRPKKAYYINFQDPKGQPKANPLNVGGKTYLKIGWEAYDKAKGYGWFGQYINNPKIAKYQYLSGPASVSPVQRSILYDDYGRKNTFEFDLPNGAYKVTVSVGWHGKTYKLHQVWIEGTQVIKDEKTDASNKHYIVRSHNVQLQDGKLTLEMGGKSPVSKDFEYTMLNYLVIEPQ